MRAVDTNVLVRLLTGDDAKQAKAALAFLATDGRVWVSQVVLVETSWVLRSVYGRSRSELGNAIETLLDHDAISLQEPDVVAAALSLFRRYPRVDFSDAMVLEIARKAGHLPVGTFDRALATAEGARLL